MGVGQALSVLQVGWLLIVHLLSISIGMSGRLYCIDTRDPCVLPGVLDGTHPPLTRQDCLAMLAIHARVRTNRIAALRYMVELLCWLPRSSPQAYM